MTVKSPWLSLQSLKNFHHPTPKRIPQANHGFTKPTRHNPYSDGIKKQTCMQREREREKEKERERERGRAREKERERETARHGVPWSI